MFYKSFLYIVLILTIISTIVLCSIKPKMHTAVLIYDSSYTITEVKETKVEQKTTKTVTNPVQKKTEVKKVLQTQQKEEKEIKQQPIVQVEAKSVKTVKAIKPKEEIKDKVIKVENTVVKTTAPKVEATVQKIKPQVNIEEQKDVIEEIEWNKWRSNIQNQIMKDVKLPMLPNGTIFKFSFDVDKYGRITNIQTWSTTPAFTPYAVQYIAPVIRSYQGRSILDFPTGSQRINTVVTGQWKISTSQKYSTSSNFHDIESVQKGK